MPQECNSTTLVAGTPAPPGVPRITLASKEDQNATRVCCYCCAMIVGKRYRVGPNLACGNCAARVAARAAAASGAGAGTADAAAPGAGLSTGGGGAFTQIPQFRPASETSVWSFQGRIGRAVFWGRTILVEVLCAAAGFVAGRIGHAVASAGIYAVITAWLLCIPAFILAVWAVLFSLVTQTKRWHDLGHSGWMFLLNFTLIAQPFIFVYLGFFKGTKGPNRFGADPV